MLRINEKFIDFIRSNKMSDNFEAEKYGTKYNAKIEKKPLKNENFLAIYVTTQEDRSDPFSDLKTRYLCTINKNTLDILHFTTAGMYDFNEKFLLYDDYSDWTQKQYFLAKPIAKIRELLLQRLKDNEEEFLKEVNLDDYKDEILERYKNKTPRDQLDEDVSINVTFDIINDYYTDPDKFINKYVDIFYNEKNISSYTKFAAIEKGYREYVEFLENDDVGKTRNELIKILDNSKYKTLKINYLKPNGTLGLLEYSKDNYHFYNVKNEILKQDKIENIPIKAIESITWGRSTLYKVTEEQRKKMKYSEKEHIDDFIKLKHSGGYPKYIYKDKKYIQKLFEACGAFILKNVDKDLLSDSIFMKDFVKNNISSSRAILLNLKDSPLFLDKEFIEFVLSNYIKDKAHIGTYEVEEFINTLDPKILNDPDIAKLIFSTNKVTTYNMIKKFEKSILNDPEIVEILSKCELRISNNYSGSNAHLLELFNSSENLLKIFNINDLRNNISYIDEHLLCSDKALMMLLLEEMTISHGNKLFSNLSNNYLEYYKEDNDIIDKIVKIATGTKTIDKVAAILRINPQYDQTKLYELASVNIEFLKKLTDDEISLYFEDEIASLTEDIDYDDDILSIKAAFGTFIFEARYSGIHIEFEDLNEHTFTINTNKKVIEDTALYYLKKFIPSSEIELIKFLNNESEKIEQYIESKNLIRDDEER